MPSKSRSWCFTLNNYTDQEYEYVKSIESVYIIVGKEVGEGGTPHLQGFIYFSNPKTLAFVKGKIPRAHLEIAKGDVESNVTYCSKDGDIFESGVRPISQKRKGELEIARFDDAKKAAIEGRLDDIPSDIFVRYYRTLKEIKKDFMRKPDDCEDICGVWIYGISGAGKSRMARTEYPGSYFKLCNKWWDGYQGEGTVILDDIGPDHKFLGHHLKLWSDRYAFIAETKGGALLIRPTKFVVTSQYSIEQIFDDVETCAALSRRFNVIHKLINES
jgi:hypothetical protein